MYYLGFDIGGSSIKAVLVKDKKIVKSKIIDLPDSLDGLLASLVELKQELAAGVEKEIGGAGFAVAGILNAERSKMLKSPNIEFFDDQPLGELFESIAVSYPIKIEHDACCFLLAEKKIGLAQELKNVFYLTVGTGVGGAFMVDGKIVSGAHGSAGEIGHAVIDIKDNFDLEDLSADDFVKKTLGVSAEEAEKLARSGDGKAKEVFVKRAKNLGIGMANLINIFDPEAIIIGGGIVSAKDLLLPGIRTAIEKYIISPEAKKTQILFSELGRFGGALGAALLFEAGN